ncbi:MAG: bacillithiol system redox-active protein YtxJ [Acidobacteriota bacterium]
MVRVSARAAPMAARYNVEVPSFLALNSESDLDAVMAASHTEPVILFKHSQTCGVSLMARDVMSDSELPAPVHEVVVQRHRDVSQAIATRLSVRHESPQVFVVARGVAVWHSSHNGVRPERITAAWLDAAASFTAPAAVR